MLDYDEMSNGTKIYSYFHSFLYLFYFCILTLNYFLAIILAFLEIKSDEKDFSVGQYFQSKFQTWLPKTIKKIQKNKRYKKEEAINKDDGNIGRYK